jgi:AraC family transcriptional regulator
MTPAGKALWFIESHFAEVLTLDAIAAAGNVSRHHMARAFAEATGQPVMRYLRGRRLSEAARALANGAPDILAVALAAGYGSHEAFTRAFREQFGLTPEAVREQGSTDDLTLVEPLKMDESLLDRIDNPRIVDSGPLLIAGIGTRYVGEAGENIPSQWQHFAPHIGHIPGQLGNTAYGVCCHADEGVGFEYICGVEVSDVAHLPAGWSHLRLAAQRYAVFLHREHISTIRRTCNTIWNIWLPQSGHKAAMAPFFERYPDSFNPHTGLGGVEVWIPLER